MVAKDFKAGDLVWAKMKGFPFWPAKVSNPPTDGVKKAQHYVFFFGSKNFAWIPDENIELHSQKLVDKFTKNQKRPGAVYLSAIDEIVSASKDSLKYFDESESSSEESVSKENESDNARIVSKKKSPIDKRRLSFEKAVREKKKNSSEKKKLQKEKRKSIEKSIKKDLKRISSFDGEKSLNSSQKKPRTDDDYSELIKNLPPYNTILNETVASFNNDLQMSSRITSDDFPSTAKDENEFSKSDNVEPTTKKIGFLGLGNLGQRMVRNLIATSHSVMIWNRTRSKCEAIEKAEIADSPADVIKACDITFCCMSNAQVSKNLISETLGIREGFEAALSDASTGEKKGFVELTTLDPESSEIIDQAITTKGGRYLEAPITGSLSQADAGNLFFIAAGDISLFNDCNSCFNALGKTTLYVGADAGTAAKFNILHNTILGAGYATIAESLALIEPIGLGPSDFLDILSNGELNIQDVIDKGRAMLDKNTFNEIPLHFMAENINQALLLGSATDQPLYVISAVHESYKHCMLLKYGDRDVSAVYDGAKN